MNLQQLRKQHPEIQARSKKDFLKKLETQKGIKRVSPGLRLHFKEYFAVLINKDINKAYTIFMDEDKFKKQWSKNGNEIDTAMIKLYYDLFGERVKKTSCVLCIANRVFRIRKYFRRYVGRGFN